jgi:hypothetical protein
MALPLPLEHNISPESGAESSCQEYREGKVKCTRICEELRTYGAVWSFLESSGVFGLSDEGCLLPELVSSMKNALGQKGYVEPRCS